MLLQAGKHKKLSKITQLLMTTTKFSLYFSLGACIKVKYFCFHFCVSTVRLWNYGDFIEYRYFIATQVYLYISEWM